jgi:hypothetical protein
MGMVRFGRGFAIGLLGIGLFPGIARAGFFDFLFPLDDESLRHGDAVMTGAGIRIFVGDNSSHTIRRISGCFPKSREFPRARSSVAASGETRLRDRLRRVG